MDAGSLMEAVADNVFAAVKGFVDRRVKALADRLDGIDARFKALEDSPAPAGQKGRDGADGANGKDGRDGVDGKDGISGIDGANGVDGKAGRDGLDGQKGVDGRDRVDGTPGLDGQDGAAGHDGRDGKDGRDAKDGEKGIDGRDGRDGRDGEDGLDGFQPEIVPLDPAKSYRRGTFATHKGGLWRAGATTDGMRGWDLILRGIDTIEFEQDADDFRKSVYRFVLSDGTKEFAPRCDAPFFTGPFKPESTKARTGDVVVFGGSSWIAMRETEAAPGTGTQDWIVLARKGRDGKDGEPGQKGRDGLNGRDLTRATP